MTISKEQLYNIWFNVWDIPGWLRILMIGNCLFPSAIKELEKIDDEAIAYTEEAKKEYDSNKVNMRLELKEFEKEFDLKLIQNMRLTYLSERIRVMNNLIRSFWKEKARRAKTDIPSWLQETFIELFNLDKMENKLKRLMSEKHFLESPIQARSSEQVNQAQIERAREFPFTELIEFNKTGFAFCPFHNEKLPSFHYIKHKNKAHCFSCKWTGDPIEFLMKTADLTFMEAVLKLL